MDRTIAGVASLTGVALFALGWSGFRAHGANHAALEELRTRVERLTEQPPPPRPATEQGSAFVAEFEKTLEGLSQRLTRLETAPRRVAVPRVPSESYADPTPAGGEEPTTGPRDDVVRREFEDLLSQLAESGWDYAEAGERYQRFLEITRNTGFLDERITDLEERVAAAPQDVNGRMELADAYVARLMTVSGPEQGLWGTRAEEQWLAVVDLDDGSWRAHSSLGTNYSYYPEVMGKGEDAIHHLERAWEIQSNTPPAPEHVQTYLFLARLYERASQTDKAREVLIDGLRAHAGNPQLETALARLE